VGGADAPGLRPGRPTLSALRRPDGLLATIDDPGVMHRILAHLALPQAGLELETGKLPIRPRGLPRPEA